MASYFRELVTRGQHSYIHMEQFWHFTQWELVVYKNTIIGYESCLLISVSSRLNIRLKLQKLALTLSLYTGSIIQSGHSVAWYFQITCTYVINFHYILKGCACSCWKSIQLLPDLYKHLSVLHRKKIRQVNQRIVWKCHCHWNFISCNILMLSFNLLITHCFYL